MAIFDKMNGQWVGEYTAEGITGKIRIDIDELESVYFGSAYVFAAEPTLPTIIAHFTTPNKDREFSFRASPLRAFDFRSGSEASWQDVKSIFPDRVVFPSYADVTGSYDRESLTLSWKTDLGTVGNSKLPRTRAGEASELKAIAQDWGTFKKFGIERAATKPFFRGQRNPWRLRIPFHRSGRANMLRFISNDIPTLHRNLSARTKHYFNLDRQDEFGAFINLVQHHGYPTPVLDWTFSPYVAAFFAYRNLSIEESEAASPETKVRVLVFDAQSWLRDFEHVAQLVHPKLFVTIRAFTAIENDRVVPQQAMSTVSSVDDIETHLRNIKPGTEYLEAIDLPMNERAHVMRELRYMGITAGSLFPGLDGACEEIREGVFDLPTPSIQQTSPAKKEV